MIVNRASRQSRGYASTRTHRFRPHRPRLWKCRRRGNHRTISTAAWKSRTEREIPTFPQAAFRFEEENKQKTKTEPAINRWTPDRRLGHAERG